MQDRDRRIVLISRLSMLLTAIEPYFESIAAALGGDSAFFDTLEKYVFDLSHRFSLECAEEHLGVLPFNEWFQQAALSGSRDQ